MSGLPGPWMENGTNVPLRPMPSREERLIVMPLAELEYYVGTSAKRLAGFLRVPWAPDVMIEEERAILRARVNELLSRERVCAQRPPAPDSYLTTDGERQPPDPDSRLFGNE